MQIAARPIETRKVQPAIDRDRASQRPTETRYAWCPFGDINLKGPDGTMALHVQPEMINDGDGNIPNPYHGKLPKGQLIPFPTFSFGLMKPSPDQTDANGRAVLVESTEQMTALAAAVQVLRGYSAWGFTILNSLQGLDQDTAMRIFQVVQPFDYPLSRLVNELAFGAQERIDSEETLTFADAPGYAVQPLYSEQEREIARALATEMEAGAQIAFDLATETLDTTEASMTQRFAGGQGKAGADQLDKRLSAELNRELPKVVGTANKISENDAKIDFLVNRAINEDQKKELEELRRENAALKAGQSPSATTETSTCGHLKEDGSLCAMVTKNGEKCRWHRDEENAL